MKRIVSVGCAVVLILTVLPLASAQSTKLPALFDQANQMNNEEQDMAKELRSKAGDNQTLVTMADTIRDDHKANQSALEALAKQKNITLKSYQKNEEEENKLDGLNGAQFNHEFLTAAVRDHEKALEFFRRAKSSFAGDRDVQVYIDQTIPVLEAHLKMAQNLRRDDTTFGSAQNATNNKGTD
jgi:putative membrane protein